MEYGLLFRTLEKLFEFRQFLLNLGFLERLDYVSGIIFLNCVLLNINIFELSLDIGTLLYNIFLIESTRICNHILNVSCTLSDAGCLSAILCLFEYRELLWEIFEIETGARLHNWITHFLIVFNNFHLEVVFHILNVLF